MKKIFKCKNCNKENNSLLDYEEAMIVYSLKRDHLMDQEQISKLLCYSRSWVCRRLALIEKLDISVQDEIKLGVLSNSQARELIKLYFNASIRGTGKIKDRK